MLVWKILYFSISEECLCWIKYVWLAFFGLSALWLYHPTLSWLASFCYKNLLIDWWDREIPWMGEILFFLRRTFFLQTNTYEKVETDLICFFPTACPLANLFICLLKHLPHLQSPFHGNFINIINTMTNCAFWTSFYLKRRSQGFIGS